jgi:hypothetical protein
VARSYRPVLMLDIVTELDDQERSQIDETYTAATTAVLRLYGRQATESHVWVWLAEAAGFAARQTWVQYRLGPAAAAVLTLERGRAYLLSEALRPAKNPAARPVRAGVLGGGSNR